MILYIEIYYLCCYILLYTIRYKYIIEIYIYIYTASVNNNNNNMIIVKL